MVDLPQTPVPVLDRAYWRAVEHTKRRLARLNLSNPQAVATAHRRAEGHFWGALAMARHNHRMLVASRTTELIPTSALAGLCHVNRADAILSQFGEIWSLAPDGWIHGRQEWPAHVQWGADRYVETIRHLGAGRSLAAAVIARSQLERWTINVADHHGVDPDDDRDTAAWITRVWQVYKHHDLDMGRAWSELSEFLHGRGSLTAGQQWERSAGEVNRDRLPLGEETRYLHHRIVEIEAATFAQVRGCVSTLALENGRAHWAQLMRNDISILSATWHSRPVEIFSHQLDATYANGPWAQKHAAVARGYRLSMKLAAETDRVAHIEPNAAMGCLIERRMRSVERFRHSLGKEQRLLGDEFDVGTLHTRLFRFIAITEAAELASYWAPEAERIALRLAAGALRSAFHFWLEDTDLSLPCIRTLLEQTCVAHAWRQRPQRAQRVADSTGARRSPARWIDAAGWKRAAILGKALGEFSHVSLRSRTNGARALLTAIQPDENPHKALTARRHALESAAYLLAFEVAERLHAVDPRLADGFRTEVTLMTAEEHLAATEDLLQRSQALRDYDFGFPDHADWTELGETCDE
ncbi:hypothetical protein HDA40_001852 [Hamadaea flava]|uniref:Uncharacterized protein n=1 Tax=Hamadaea flava TaxID=1742688 RepID=A0ABV8LSI0_9ACTN|nr:hypothetical protein [Hamadaea flava]MCP2323345.1 hypothetical protein [Hamadaea flava]